MKFYRPNSDLAPKLQCTCEFSCWKIYRRFDRRQNDLHESQVTKILLDSQITLNPSSFVEYLKGLFMHLKNRNQPDKLFRAKMEKFLRRIKRLSVQWHDLSFLLR